MRLGGLVGRELLLEREDGFEGRRKSSTIALEGGEGVARNTAVAPAKDGNN